MRKAVSPISILEKTEDTRGRYERSDVARAARVTCERMRRRSVEARKRKEKKKKKTKRNANRKPGGRTPAWRGEDRGDLEDPAERNPDAREFDRASTIGRFVRARGGGGLERRKGEVSRGQSVSVSIISVRPCTIDSSTQHRYPTLAPVYRLVFQRGVHAWD